jgi:hypothetical protein
MFKALERHPSDFSYLSLPGFVLADGVRLPGPMVFEDMTPNQYQIY